MAKYKNYTELAEAFRSGELSREEWVLVLDNDSTHLDWRGPCPAGVDEDDHRQSQYEMARRDLFEGGNGYYDIEDLCAAAGIPAEWC